MRLRLILVLLQLAWFAVPARAAEDMTPRLVVMSAFQPELTALAAATTDKKTVTYASTVFTTGMLEGKPVVLLLSGVSMVNAAMNTQLALDHFNARAIVFSGIAGGVDPNLDVGDVVVADRWAQYLEGQLTRETAPGQFMTPNEIDEIATEIPPMGMTYVRSVQMYRGGKNERKLWFEADPALLAVARKVSGEVTLTRCIAELCLVKPPKVVVGGAGVSGQVFLDNAAVRTWAYTGFKASVADMETAAVGQVAYLNDKPFIAFRSLSDLAGGDPGKNQARTFFQIASDNSALVVRAFLRALPWTER